MERKYTEYSNLNLIEAAKKVSDLWTQEKTFERSLEKNKDAEPFIFYEGPPSANGKPGIHHVMARAIKDIFCRYKTMKGYNVKRKAGWDTHGLPVEISVEKTLGITKEDIGEKISVEDYNKACREEVMKYKGLWDDLTRKMGFWIDLDDPYITFDNKYIETIWYLLKNLFDKDLLYKGYTIQPYSPAAGTGLSTHELNQPGCYRMVKDNTVVAQFKVQKDETSRFLWEQAHGEVFFLAWTTTPWTLPSNTALAVGKNIDYVLVNTFNRYTGLPISVVVAKELMGKYFSEKNAELKLEDYSKGDKNIPFEIAQEFKGKDIENIRYEQLLPYAQPEEGDAFRVVLADFVTTDEGTGVVHIAPSFGADDFKVGTDHGIGSLTMVNKKGQFVEEMGEFAGRFVKPEYDDNFDPKSQNPVDVDIIIKLKKENRAFLSEKYEHSYPHCWRTDKPILYYPLDSWFIKTTDFKERMLELNRTINWKPESTGTGRFGNWLENLVDWNLSRSRFWGTPLPVWSTEDREERKCIGSVKELKTEIDKAIDAGVMDENPIQSFEVENFAQENYDRIDLHRPYVDRIVLVSDSGKKMQREPDLIDVWFDSGAMPYAQQHFPFENRDEFENNFPADFIAEGVDQTRGWFFTLHAIATMTSDSVAFKNVISNGLVLDKNGNKMSKRLGNGVDPFKTIQDHGPDATRWYMITNAQPWDNLKFDLNGLDETKRKFFGTLYNTYNFFAMYANIDGFNFNEKEVPFRERPEIDRWILSELNTLIKNTDDYYNDYEPTKAGRAIVTFVYDYLSNWYVRLSRRKFWKGEYSQDKISAYQTLYKCLEVVARLSAPIAPFFMEQLYRDLNNVTNNNTEASVHLAEFPAWNQDQIDKDLEERMQLAQKFSSMVLSLRKKSKMRVRQPLKKMIVPVENQRIKEQIEKVKDLILAEVNVKEMELITETAGILVKKIKPDFKKLGPKYGKMMKKLAPAIQNLSQDDIVKLEKEGSIPINVEDQQVDLSLEDVEIFTEDIPGLVVANWGSDTVALDIELTEELKEEGLARDLINRIQNLRKECNLEVTDHINLKIESHEMLNNAIHNNFSYICSETLASNLDLVDELNTKESAQAELNDEIKVRVNIQKVS
ncbi:MAG: isoleucine--tRNA ligase [Bacteroidales bacterium]|nr:isoleucine--tRNA ligase [Bacteroidales bacterium]MCF8326668.1 isoleucine--tRNA ligase [Bacteroidales bacterium]